MSTDPQVNLDRARAHVRTQQLAVRHFPAYEGIVDAEILSESPWPHHKIEAGWLFLHAFMELRKQKDIRRSSLVTRARDVWGAILERPEANPAEYLRAKQAICYLPMWTHVKQKGGPLSKRKQERQIDQFRILEQHSLDIYDMYTTSDNKSDIIGIMNEINFSGILNRSDFHNGRDRVTIPAQTWYDQNYLAKSGSSFDFWQVEDNIWRKVQVKSTRNNRENEPEYDEDIAVVYLSDHWPDTPALSIAETLLLCRSDDSKILGVADSIQAAIDQHFQQFDTAA